MRTDGWAVVAMEAPVPGELAQLAEEYGLAVLCAPGLAAACRQLARVQPFGVILPLHGQLEVACELIRWLAGRAWRPRIVAVAVRHAAAVELAARAAGAACYVPDPSRAALEPLLRVLLQRPAQTGPHSPVDSCRLESPLAKRDSDES